MGDAQPTNGPAASRSGLNPTLSNIASSYMGHLLLPCDDGDHVLAEVGPGNIARLPKIRIPKPDNKHFSWDELERKVEEKFSFPVCLVKQEYKGKEEDVDNPGCEILQYIWVLHPAGDLPPMTEPLKWVHKDDVVSYKWPKVIRSLIADHIREEIQYLFEEDIPATFEMRAKPWEGLGFYKQLMSWSRGVLSRRNMVMEGRIRVLQGAGENGRIFTCAARTQDGEHVDRTTGGSEVIFIKCTLPEAREVERAVAVASVFGDIVPEILGFDAQRGVMIQRNAGKMTDEVLDQEALVGAILRMQRASLKHIPELEAKGLPVRDTEWLESKMESILNHVIFEELFEHLEDCMSICDDERETIKSLRSKLSELRNICRQISKLGLPNTIVHGDCHEGNIGSSTTTRDGKTYRFFDWAKAHIGSPLVDFDFIFPSPTRAVKTNNKDWEAGVRQVCEEWKQLASLTYADLLKAIDNMGSLQLLLEVYELEEQFDLCMARAKEDDEFDLELTAHQIRIYRSLRVVIEILGDVNERIQLER